ncbi:plasmid partition protein [Streptomyces sp. NPDC045456]|uniref:plasmid partition protein n=1 Tax=Streptomyces sp. NPDC045456 TaxID=3155254 RepID=UPI0033E1E8B8
MWIASLSPRSTGKTTNTWWLLHALHERGYPVTGFDADESHQLFRWWEARPDEDGEDGPPFVVHKVANTNFHVEAPPKLPEGHIGVVDCGHLENHQGIGRSVLRITDLALIACAPTNSDVERMDELPMDFFLQMASAKRPDRTPPPHPILLCRNQVGATKTLDSIRDSLRADDWDVLTTVIPAIQLYANTGEGMPVQAKGTHFDALVTELETRGWISK